MFRTKERERRCFWREALTVQGSVTPLVLGRVVAFGVLGLVAWLGYSAIGWDSFITLTPFEFVGVALGLLLVLRTNSGYDRWYEARKLWGGIVNQSRNLAILGLTFGPQREAWRQEFATWVAVFPHVVRHSLRGERDLSGIAELLSEEELAHVAAAEHMPMYVAARISRLLRSALESGEIDRFAFHRAEAERCALIDHLGACERILKTPLAAAFSIETRRFLFIYLALLPLALVKVVGPLTPLVIMMVAYPCLSLEQIGFDLQNPFSKSRLSHLPLDEISLAIEHNVLALASGENPPPVTTELAVDATSDVEPESELEMDREALPVPLRLKVSARTG